MTRRAEKQRHQQRLVQHIQGEPGSLSLKARIKQGASIFFSPIFKGMVIMTRFGLLSINGRKQGKPILTNTVHSFRGFASHDKCCTATGIG
jgi:hypothetical protein